MWKGNVVAIHVAAENGGPVRALPEANLVPGKGIEGDRNYTYAEEHPDEMKPKKEVTLVESEAVAAIASEDGIAMTAGETRRNIETKGVPLNHLVGRKFRVGAARLKGLELCEPCGYLETLTQKGVVKALMHRAGLRAQILTGGTVRPGDPIEEA